MRFNYVVKFRRFSASYQRQRASPRSGVVVKNHSIMYKVNDVIVGACIVYHGVVGV